MVLQREITSSKHSDSKSKSKATKKSSKHTRKWSPDEDVALCAARAVAETWRIASGRPVSDSAVLDLYWSAASDADAGLSILDALEAARECLVGFNPAWVWPIPATAPVLRRVVPLDLEGAIGVDGTVPVIDGTEEDPVVAGAACQHALDRYACLACVPAGAPLGDWLPHQDRLPVSASPDLPWSDLNGRGPCAPALAPGRSIAARERQPGRTRCGLFGYVGRPGTSTVILGLDLPLGEPHAVVAHDGAWWSWGEPYAPYDPDWFPGAVIDEAWAVTWS